MSTDLGWVTLPTEGFERLHAQLRELEHELERVRQEKERHQLEFRKQIQLEHQEIQRLRRVIRQHIAGGHDQHGELARALE